MVEQRKPGRTTRSEKTRDVRSVRRFLEELSWVLTSNSHIDFKVLADAYEASIEDRAVKSRRLSGHVSKNPNIHFLIGTLPTVFRDEKLFPSNEDIAEFAREALGLSVARWEKRSKYELIGLIVCETADLDDDRLSRLVDVLTRIVSEDSGAQRLLSDRKTKRISWNEIIQRLYHEGRDE